MLLIQAMDIEEGEVIRDCAHVDNTATADLWSAQWISNNLQDEWDLSWKNDRNTGDRDPLREEFVEADDPKKLVAELISACRYTEAVTTFVRYHGSMWFEMKSYPELRATDIRLPRANGSRPSDVQPTWIVSAREVRTVEYRVSAKSGEEAQDKVESGNGDKVISDTTEEVVVGDVREDTGE